ncbi:MAG: hypothetical protein PHT07_15005 [Paludibacter sp.]|nr:hypothetical protein [Paludibacter sp.]
MFDKGSNKNNRIELLQWISFGNVDIASRTMWLGITGLIDKPEPMSELFNIPMDSFDFERCMELVNSCHITKEQLEKIKIPFPWFAPIIDNWDELVNLSESTDIWKTGNVFTRLKHLRPECMKISGFIEVRTGYWQRLPVNL